MSTIITDLVGGIKTTMGTTLGGSFSEIPYVIDISKNNFNQNNNRYGVVV